MSNIAEGEQGDKARSNLIPTDSQVDGGVCCYAVVIVVVVVFVVVIVAVGASWCCSCWCDCVL